MAGRDDTHRLGWLGIGRMGVEMGRRLLGAGCDLAGFKRSMGKAGLAAPVMGNPKVVRAGKMTAAVSGPRDAFDLAEPYLDMLGHGVTYVGDGEEARTVKLCHNLILGVVAQSLAEITVLAEKSGISSKPFIECLNQSVR